MVENRATRSYSDIGFHKEIGRLIKKYSENGEDIREVAAKTIDWHNVHRILDLGCGYGWFEEKLRREFDFILGIDCLDENEPEFLRIASRITKRAIFKKMHLPSPIEAQSSSLDLVVSAYSLYFFPEAIPEAKRVLTPEGAFLIITHSGSMLEEGKEFFHFKNLSSVIEKFSAENGGDILKEHFKNVSHVDYPNALVFKKDAKEDLAKYIDFKGGFISKDVDPRLVREKMLHELEKRGALRLNKNDRIFVAKK